ncbi:hypothetical protein Xbed_03392 [Xenorhabdus beddingii]|uniref:Uncharacterized protein n=1 Tax=Xenorhabdus beddingii TaxID=40578 RepID=A0A1Y2SE88_9GAMM|nr:hypothetical protein [Xenorhabdus beddingii]OTA16998.1 hypothetical protein Xbed_03392 [Xenorhabdus beddingii]
MNPTLVKKFLLLINCKNQDGTYALQQYVEPSGITNLIIRVDDYHTLADMYGDYLSYLYALGFERKSKNDSDPNRKNLEFILRQDDQNTIPVTIDSYARCILPDINKNTYKRDDKDKPGLKILAESQVQGDLRRHWSVNKALPEQQYRNNAVKFLRQELMLSQPAQTPPVHNPMQPSGFNEQQMQQAMLVSHSQHLQQLAEQSASRNQPGPSGFNSRLQQSNVSIGDQPGTSGLNLPYQQPVHSPTGSVMRRPPSTSQSLAPNPRKRILQRWETEQQNQQTTSTLQQSQTSTAAGSAFHPYRRTAPTSDLSTRNRTPPVQDEPLDLSTRGHGSHGRK